jgi:lipopolysaccharide biosynthesis glycosyltransferase
MIAIGLCVDRAYLVPALVTLVSFADSHDAAIRRSMSVRLLSPDLRRGEAQAIETIVRKLGFLSADFRRVGPPPFAPIIHGKYISKATYLRFEFDAGFVREPFLLYLDSDLMIMGDMTEPFNYLQKACVGAVRDEIIQEIGREDALPGFDTKYPQFRGQPYFNAGVLWFHATTLKATNTGCKKALLRREHIHFNDQDALNIWLTESRSWFCVPGRFNRLELARFLQESDWIKSVTESLPKDDGTTAVHFVGPLKPWLSCCPSVSGVQLYQGLLHTTLRLLGRLRNATLDLMRRRPDD